MVYGDVGTSPLDAFRQSIAHLKRAGGAIPAADVVGVVSLMFWTLMVICTVKYVLVLLRFETGAKAEREAPDPGRDRGL